jgi:hypothetical protein
VILTFSWISQNCFYIGKSPGSGLWITGPQMALGSLLTHDHGAARPLRGSGGRRDSSERERERGGRRVLTNGTTWRRSCKDGHTTSLNRGDWWCYDGEMISNTRRRDWSQGGVMDNGGGVLSSCLL